MHFNVSRADIFRASQPAKGRPMDYLLFIFNLSLTILVAGISTNNKKKTNCKAKSIKNQISEKFMCSAGVERNEGSTNRLAHNINLINVMYSSHALLLTHHCSYRSILSSFQRQMYSFDWIVWLSFLMHTANDFHLTM